MATVTAAMVKELREITGVGMSACKVALVEADSNIEKAVEILREKGLSAAKKKAGRAVTEGLVDVSLTENSKMAVIVEVNSETDFVAKNQIFKDYVAQVAAHILKSTATSMDELLKEKWIDDESITVVEALSQKISVIGENLSIRRFERIDKKDNGVIVPYVHGNGRVCVLVDLKSEVVNDKLIEAGKNICMQIAAMFPKFLDSKSISPEFIDKEKEILRAQAINEGKSANIVDKMITGRLNKQLKEVCLLEQEYVRDLDINVSEYLKLISKEIGSDITINSFVRYETGEGLEKKEENFAEEVNKAMGN